MPADAPDPDFTDAEDVAEEFDETHYSEDGDETVDPDLFDEAYDDTQKLGDDDDDDALTMDEDDFDPDALDDEDVEGDELDDRPDQFQPDDNAIPGDDDDDLDGDFDEDGLGDDEIEGLEVVADADTVEGGEDDVSNFQSRRVSDEDLAAMGYNDSIEPPKAGEARKAAQGKPDPHTEENLDEGLEETFPASDPVSISPSRG